MTRTLPVKKVEEYTRFGEPAKVAETSAGKTRRTTTEYDGADRITSVGITSDEGVALAATTTDYDILTGQPTVTRSGGAAIIREYYLLGRFLTYTDADGGVTRNEFDSYADAFFQSPNVSDTLQQVIGGKVHYRPVANLDLQLSVGRNTVSSASAGKIGWPGSEKRSLPSTSMIGAPPCCALPIAICVW